MQVIKQWWQQRNNQWLLGLLLGGLLVRGTIARFLPPGFDEAYYYLYTQHLDWSYFDHPLLVALTTGLGVWLTGDVSQFTIRIGSLLLYTGSLWLLYLTSAQLFSPLAARLTLTIATLIPIFQVGVGVLTLPDSPLMFFWTATLSVAAVEFFRQSEDYQPSYRLAIIGLFVGCACLGKYHGLALGFGLIGFCLTNRRYRSALTSPWTLASVTLFLIAIAPIVLWNAQHDWVSLRFQSGRAVPDRGYSLLDLVVTVLAGIAYLFPTFGIPLWKSIGRAVVNSVQPFPKQAALVCKQRFILWMGLPLIGIFTLMGGYRAILPTWPMPGFWTATLLLGYQVALWHARSSRGVRRWLGSSGLAIALLLFVGLLHVTVGVLQKPSQYAVLGGFLSPAADASVQLLDIQQLRSGLAQSAVLRSALEQTDFLFTSDLFLAGQVGMAIAPLTSKPVTCFEPDPRGFAFWSTAEEWVGQDGLYITPQRQESAATRQFLEYFDRIDKLANISIQRGGTIVEVLQVYQCQRLLKPYPRPYGNYLQKESVAASPSMWSSRAHW